MQLLTYLNYAGNCRQAFEFYAKELGGTITLMTVHGENPAPGNLPPDWKDKVLHARIDLGGTTLLGADIPGAEPMRSAYLTMVVDSVPEAERLYALLTEAGQIFMPMADTFFAKRFAMFRDRFGTSWMLLHQPAQS